MHTDNGDSNDIHSGFHKYSHFFEQVIFSVNCIIKQQIHTHMNIYTESSSLVMIGEELGINESSIEHSRFASE